MLKTDFCTLKSTAAASLPEYGLTVGLVAVISIGSVSAVGQEILSTMQTSSEEIRGIGSGAYNHVLNGDFSVTTNMDETFYGFNAYDIFGWTSLNGEIIQYTESGYMDLTSKKGLYSVDIYGSTASIDIEQVIDSLAKDRSYTLSLHVADRHAPMGDAQAHIYWGGSQIATISPAVEDTWELHSFEIVEGAGDGLNKLRITGSGNLDKTGINIDDIRITGN